MEIESKNGSKIKLRKTSKTIDFGRGVRFDTTDRTVSRHHISFKLDGDRTVLFEVKGKNPICVRDSRNDEIRVYKSSERGEMKNGDSFCVCSKNPVWFNLKRIETEDEDDNESKSEIRYDDVFAETSGVDYGELDSGDVSDIDPVKEFNFVVMGHEFDSYPKKMIRDIRNWNWFLEEPKQESDEDDISDRKSKKGTRKKRKKGGRGDDEDDDDDDVWTGESEEDAELIKKMKKDLKPKYSTRSKKQDKNKKGKGASSSKSVGDTTKRDAMNDDDDETLGGFIVDDDDIGEGNNDDDEEDEFEEDEDDE